MKKRTKRYQQIIKQLKEIEKQSTEKDGAKIEDRKKCYYYSIPESLGVLKALPQPKFDATVEIAIKLGIDPKKSEHQVRSSVSFPKGIGKTKRVIVFAAGKEADEARAAGATEVGLEDLIKKIEGGWTDFDVAITPPSLMKQVSKLGRILGPIGKMPSPKTGTVTDEISVAVKEFKAGKTEYRNDADGNLHLPVGKISFSVNDLEANINMAIEHIKSHRPSGIKGDFIRSITVSSTMGPGLSIKLK
ncbi:MAG: 50S ribosomal protein L1 [Planctomycetota bacterium]|nr:50S ribosomal protein L1 [Planctomycetota bacterium]MDI6787352.1 50S ribosomal protein L1 [Planctomycetota bacterium]